MYFKLCKSPILIFGLPRSDTKLFKEMLNFNDSIVLLNQNLTIVFTSPSSDSFTIPSQTYYAEVYNPTIGNRVFTNVVYEGSGSISNSENNYLNINFTYTFFDQTANFQFTTS